MEAQLNKLESKIFQGEANQTKSIIAAELQLESFKQEPR